MKQKHAVAREAAEIVNEYMYNFTSDGTVIFVSRGKVSQFDYQTIARGQEQIAGNRIDAKCVLVPRNLLPNVSI